MVRRAQCQCGGFTATAATEPGVVIACGLSLHLVPATFWRIGYDQRLLQERRREVGGQLAKVRVF